MGLFDVFKKGKKEEDPQRQERPKTAAGMYTFVVQDIFTLKSQGSVVVGVVEGDTIRVGDPVYVVKRGKQFLQAVVTAMENPVNGRMNEASPKTNVALMFRELASAELEKGDVVCNVRPTFSYENGEINPRLQGLMAERSHTIIKNLEEYIQEEIALYGQEEGVKGGAEVPRKS
jgi:GTPases - translation elongation factors